ncbi:MAG: hypothetical protein NVSMB65_13470 [Chloroflexota bacterium]
MPEDDREIRASLGLESAYGYHVVRPPGDGDGDDALDAWDAVAAMTAVGEPEVPLAQRPAAPAYPCLRGARYSGCVGMACPLTTCWTGGPTPSYAAYLERTERASAVTYLGHILCHRCVHVVPPAPAGPDGVPWRENAARPAQRVTCARAKWHHPVSVHSFATRHIPLKDDIEPLDCPAFEDAGVLHPEVAAHRARHRQAMRAYRERLQSEEDAWLRGEREEGGAGEAEAEAPRRRW